MRTDWLRSLSSNADAAEIVGLSYFENKTVTIAADRIAAVADLQTASRSTIYSGVRARVFLDDHIIDVRSDRTTVLGLIAGVTDRFDPTIDLTMALQEQVITIRAADVQMVEEMAPDPRSEIYQGDRSRVFFQDHVLIVRHTAAAVIALLDATSQRLSNYARVEDQKAVGINGGTFSAGAFRTRDLNTIVQDDDTLVSLAANQITLEDGIYYISATLPGVSVSAHAGRMQNITDAVTELEGTSERMQGLATTYSSAVVFIKGHLTVTGGPKAYELQHRCGFGVALAGFGFNSPFNSVERYTIVELWRLGA